MSTVRLNLRIISARVYLSGFKTITVLYRPGLNYVAPNTLSRLAANSDEALIKDLNDSGLDLIPTSFASLLDDVR